MCIRDRTGVDYSPVSVATARETNSDAINTHKMDILEASVEQLPFADDTFDKIITVESFYFWPSPQKNLKEVLRVLKNSGTFLLVADVYQKEGLSDKTLENIRNFHLFNPTPEEFLSLIHISKVGLLSISRQSSAASTRSGSFQLHLERNG